MNYLDELGYDGVAMVDPSLMGRIVSRPDVFSGKPIIRGMRISVDLLLRLMAQGVTRDEILADYPDLEAEGFLACLAYAHAVIANDSIDDIKVG